MARAPRPYLRRVVDDELDELLPELPAIAVQGAKAVGKTATASERARTVHALDDPGQLEIARAQPSLLVQGRVPILIDEWQRLPTSWDHVRRAVDDGASAGSFLLAGSAVPKEAPAHSGAGRIVNLLMRPMTLFERGVAEPAVSLKRLLEGGRPTIAGHTQLGLRDYAGEILASGFPGLRGLSPTARRARLDGYIDTIVERDIDEVGPNVRHPSRLRRWLTAYAAAISTTASWETIRDAATGGESNKPAKSTALPYRDALERLFVLDPVPGWAPTRNRLNRLIRGPKHQLVDPALAARLLGVEVEALLAGNAAGPAIPRDGTLLGALFEALVTLDVRVYARAAERARVGHFRTARGEREVDLIVERADGALVAIEVKLTTAPVDSDVRHLLWLREQLGDGLIDAIMVTTGSYAYRRPDGIGVVPAGLLGP